MPATVNRQERCKILSTGTTKSHWILSPFAALLIVQQASLCSAQYSPQPRWGQSAAVSNNVLYVQGGKVDEFNAYSYTSAPNTNELLSLDLSAPFNASNPPWKCLIRSTDESQGPSVAFHTLSAYSETHLLAFGGDGGPSLAVQTKQDSAWLLDISNPSSPSWTAEEEGWASQPVRRTYHSAATGRGGDVWMVGGQRVDGSAIGFRETYTFRAQSPSFTPFVDERSGSAPPDLVGHGSVILPSGLLVVIGGYSSRFNALIPLSIMFFLDTTSPNPVWGNITVGGDVPSPRRNFATALLDGNRILIHGGGDAALQTIYSDGAILDFTLSPIRWVAAPALAGGLGPRTDHLAVGRGSNVLFVFGRGPSGPASAAVSVYDANSSTFNELYSPSTSGPSTGGPTITGTPTSPFPTGGVPVSPSIPSASVVIPGQTPRPTNTPNDDESGRKKQRIVAIVLGAIFAVVGGGGLICVVAYWYLRETQRGWRRDELSSRLIAGGEPEKPHNSETNVGYPHSTWIRPSKSWGVLGLVAGRRSPPKERFDMLGDEDLRDFGRREASQGTSISALVRPRYERLGSSSRRIWDEVADASVTSLRSVGVALGVTRKDQKSPEWWEKADPFADQDARLLASIPTATAAGMVARPRGGHATSSSLGSYRDPFTDPQTPGHSRLASGASEFTYLGDSTYDPMHIKSLSSEGRTAPPPTTAPRLPSPPPVANSTVSSLTRSFGAVSSSGSDSANQPQSVASHETPSSHSRSPLSSPVSIIGAAPNAPVRRSDSWWNKFSRANLIDRNASGEPISQARKLSFTRKGLQQPPGSAVAALEIRDPNPPPRLPPLVETGLTPDPSPESAESGKKLPSAPLQGYGSHSKSFSSVKTGRTANSEALERMASGRYDAVQRLRTESSNSSSPASSVYEGWLPQATLSVVMDSSGSVEGGHSNGSQESIMPALPARSHSQPKPALRSTSVKHMEASRANPIRAKSVGGVAAKVAAFELKNQEASQPKSPVSPRSPPCSPPRSPPRSPNPKQPARETKPPSSTVNWGLAQRAPLFIANPDNTPSTASTKKSQGTP